MFATSVKAGMGALLVATVPMGGDTTAWGQWGLAGLVVGFTLWRELCWMADGRTREHWNHTAAILAMQANCHRDPKKRKKAFTPADFLPRDERPRERTKDLSILKSVFVDHRPLKESIP